MNGFYLARNNAFLFYKQYSILVIRFVYMKPTDMSLNSFNFSFRNFVITFYKYLDCNCCCKRDKFISFH